MSWAAVVGVVGPVIAGSMQGAEPLPPAQTNCEGCGAALRPQVMVCDHCKRPRRGAEKTPGYPQRDYDEMAERFARRRSDPMDARPGGIVHVSPPPAPAPSFDFTPAPSYSPPPAPAYEPPAPAPDFSSGGGGDFGGGGATGEW